MFLIDGQPMKTWNCFVGCRFDCTYCNARQLALGRLKWNYFYRDGFTPKFVEGRMKRQFKPRQFIFVAYMGDICFCARERVEEILARIRVEPANNFLFCSKNPGIYFWWNLEFPPNLYLGTTIETNRDYQLTRAPAPLLRMRGLARVAHPKRFVSIEPIMDFDLEILISWIHFLNPAIVEVGADNYRNHLVEPSGAKIEELLESLRDFVPTVVEKQGLERLKEV
ncbi:MAG: DUF5131 family protein [Nitrospirota bacterium]|nr:DUF5131 family protein [Nitrospirota bacterium]